MTGASVLSKVSAAAPWTIVARVVRFVTSIGTSVLIVRTLGADDYGLLAIVRVTVAFLAVPAGVGMGQALLRFLPELSVTTGGQGGRRLLVTGLLIQTLAWGVLCVGVAFGGESLDRFFHVEISSFVLLATVLLLAGSLRGFFDSALTASYETRLIAGLGLAGSISLLVLTAWLLHLGLGIRGILIAAGLAEMIPVVGAARRAFRVYRGSGSGIAPPRLFGYSLPFVFLTFLNMVTWKQSETLLLGHFATARDAGLFDLAYKLPQQLLEFVPESIWALVLAAMSESYTKNREGLRRLVDVYYRFLFFLVAPISVLGLVLGDRVLTVLYGPEWAPAGIYCQLFFLIFSISFFGTPLSMAIYVLEKSWANFVLALLFAVINVSLDLVLIPRFGLPGAMIPVALAVGISPFARWWMLRRFERSITIPWRFIGRAYRVALPLLLIIPFKGWIRDVPSLVIAGVIAGVMLLAAIRWMGLLTHIERDLIARSNLPLKGALLRVFAGGTA